MSDAIRLLPNLGAEEGEQWSRFSSEPRVSETARLWRTLFAWPNTLVGPIDSQPSPSDAWPPALGAPPETPVLDWLGGDEHEGSARITPWLANAAAHEWAQAQSATLNAAPADVVNRVHDKAFALEQSRALGYEPRALHDLCHAFEPVDLSRADEFVATLRNTLAAWPAWTGGRYTLKPRLGSSGRGRIGGRSDSLDATALRGALPRLAERGGAILEPWLDRTLDLSVLLHLDSDPESPSSTVLLASLEQLLTPSGGWQGHLGEVDSRGRVFSGSDYDEPMREAAAALAGSARTHGYHGPCGVDGLVFRSNAQPGDPREVLRPMLELNARFTAGFITLGLIRRALPLVRAPLALDPGERRAFLFALDTPKGWPSWTHLKNELPPTTQVIPLDATHHSAPIHPALLFTEDLKALQALLLPTSRPAPLTQSAETSEPASEETTSPLP